MARTTITQITDDLDGSKDAQKVRFSYGDGDFVIDLSKKNLAAFEKVLKPYLAAARKAPKAAPPRRTPPSRPASRANLNEIRAWAKERGIQVSDRGRIAAAVVAQYNAAH